MLETLMHNLLHEAESSGLNGSFFLHVAPNLGRNDAGMERLKPSSAGDVGTTDIQFMLTGSLKEAGLLVLLNRHLKRRHGFAPFGEDFNVRTAPRDPEALLQLVRERCPKDSMPLMVGVGDTVTSNRDQSGGTWLRGGSDRGFSDPASGPRPMVRSTQSCGSGRQQSWGGGSPKPVRSRSARDHRPGRSPASMY